MEEIINNVMQSPENTNPNVLRSQLQNIGGSSVEVVPLTVTENGTQTAPAGKAYSPVTVNVPSTNPNSTQVITANASNPFGDINVPNLLSAIENGNATATIQIDSYSRMFLEAYSYFRAQMIGYVSSEGFNNAFDCEWSGSDGTIRRAYVLQNGSVVDYTPYAPNLSTTLTIYWHPMPSGS